MANKMHIEEAAQRVLSPQFNAPEGRGPIGAEEVDLALSARPPSDYTPGTLDNEVSPLRPFTIYYDPKIGVFRVYNPLIYVCSGRTGAPTVVHVTAEEKTLRGGSPVYLNVWSEPDSSDVSTLRAVISSNRMRSYAVMIGYVPKDGERLQQYHLGAIVLWLNDDGSFSSSSSSYSSSSSDYDILNVINTIWTNCQDCCDNQRPQIRYRTRPIYCRIIRGPYECTFDVDQMICHEFPQ